MFELESCICGFHAYYVPWTPREGEVLHCAREITNKFVFCNMHCTSKIDGHFIIIIIILYYVIVNTIIICGLKLSQMTNHSVKTAKVSY